MTLPALPYSDPIRLHQVGVSLTRRLEPDDAARQRIARALDLSLFTVKRHVANIFDKLALSSRTQAAVWLRQQR